MLTRRHTALVPYLDSDYNDVKALVSSLEYVKQGPSSIKKSKMCEKCKRNQKTSHGCRVTIPATPWFDWWLVISWYSAFLPIMLHALSEQIKYRHVETYEAWMTISDTPQFFTNLDHIGPIDFKHANLENGFFPARWSCEFLMFGLDIIPQSTIPKNCHDITWIYQTYTGRYILCVELLFFFLIFIPVGSLCVMAYMFIWHRNCEEEGVEGEKVVIRWMIDDLEQARKYRNSQGTVVDILYVNHTREDWRDWAKLANQVKDLTWNLYPPIFLVHFVGIFLVWAVVMTVLTFV